MSKDIEPCGCEESQTLIFWLNHLIHLTLQQDKFHVPALEAKEWLEQLETARKNYNKACCHFMD